MFVYLEIRQHVVSTGDDLLDQFIRVWPLVTLFPKLFIRECHVK